MTGGGVGKREGGVIGASNDGREGGRGEGYTLG